jgi:hypothetical protein
MKYSDSDKLCKEAGFFLAVNLQYVKRVGHEYPEKYAAEFSSLMGAYW